MKKYCKKLNEFLDRILEKRNQNSNHKPVITTILFIMALIGIYIILQYLLENIHIKNNCVLCIANIYSILFIISLAITIITTLILYFDRLDEKQTTNIKKVFKLAFMVFVLCVWPVLIINFILEKIFGENNDIVFLFIYFGFEIYFILFSLVMLLSIMVKCNINFTSSLKMLIIAIVGYVLSILWFNIYIKFLNFENKDISEIRKAHNMISYITIFLVFIINNYILNNNAIIACAVNDAIQAITLLVLIFEERMAKCDKKDQS